MKKLLFALGATLVTATSLNAQKISIAPEIGVGFNKLNGKYGGESLPGSKMTAGLKVGGVVNYRFMPMLSIQPGVFFAAKGGKNDLSTMSLNYIEVPINVVAKFGLPGMGHIFVGAGPYVGYCMGGKAKADGETQTLKVGTDKEKSDVKPMDFGMNINAGYQLPMNLYFRLNAGIGMSNIVPGGDSDNSMKNFSFAITAGYTIGK